jgi:hypothetical protein
MVSPLCQRHVAILNVEVDLIILILEELLLVASICRFHLTIWFLL